MKSSSNPWPYAIIAFFVLAICGCAGFIVFCQINSADLVAKDYYEQEMRYQTEMEKLSRARLFSDRVSASFNPVSRQLSLALPREHATAGTSGVIQLYRPSAAKLDRSYDLQLRSDGTQQIETGALRSGLWRVRIRWKFQGQEFLAERKLEVPA